MLAELSTPEEFKKEKVRVTPLEFEKDDDSNGHIDFIVGKGNISFRPSLTNKNVKVTISNEPDPGKTFFLTYMYVCVLDVTRFLICS